MRILFKFMLEDKKELYLIKETSVEAARDDLKKLCPRCLRGAVLPRFHEAGICPLHRYSSGIVCRKTQVWRKIER